MGTTQHSGTRNDVNSQPQQRNSNSLLLINCEPLILVTLISICFKAVWLYVNLVPTWQL